MSNSKLTTRDRRRVEPLSDDYNPVSDQWLESDESIGAALARAYALILKWQMPEPKEKQQEGEPA